MVLPRVDVPSYELTLPSTDKKVKYRPFLVKEEKILYIALESKDNKEMVNALKEIVDACTFNTLKIDSLPLFDIEYVFLNIRAKSIGEIANFKVICPDDGKTYTEVNIDLSKVEVHVNDDHSNKIIIDKKRNLGLVLKYPTLSTYAVSSLGIVGEEVNTKNFESIFSILIECVYQHRPNTAGQVLVQHTVPGVDPIEHRLFRAGVSVQSNTAGLTHVCN